MAKANKQVIIDYIVSCLEKGEQRGDILVKAGKKWGISKSAFDRWLKIAKDQHKGTQEAIKKAKATIDIENGIKERYRQIADVGERKEILTKIVRGQIPLTKPMIVKGRIRHIKTVPDWADRRAAIAELNKMDGSYAPDKIANTDTEGNDVKPYTSEQVCDIIKALRENRNN